MSEEHLNPNASPDGLEDPASGVRRMNKLPIVIAAALAFIVIVVLLFAASQRANKSKQAEAAKAEEITPRSSQAGANAILQGYALDGTIPAAGPVSRPAPEQPGDEPEAPPRAAPAAAAPAAPPRATEAAPPAPAQMTEEERRRLQRARQFREDLFYDAVVADTAIQLPNNQQEGNGSGSRAPGALGAEGMEAERQRRIAQTLRASNGGGAGAAGGLSGGGSGLAGLGGLGMDGDSADPNLRARKDQFQQTSRTYGYSSEFRQAQLTPFELRVGTVIPAVMIGGINSDLPGEIIAQVSQNVRDTRTGQHILIPQGSKMIGTYDSHIAMGQRRVMVGWHRVQFPDGSTMELGNMGGVDQAGYAGFTDKVNNHYWRIFGNATLLSLISAGAQLSQPEDDNSDETTANETLAAEMGRQWSQVGQQMVRRNLNIQPTLEIRPGYRFNVMVNKDLILEPYEPLEPGE